MEADLYAMLAYVDAAEAAADDAMDVGDDVGDAADTVDNTVDTTPIVDTPVIDSKSWLNTPHTLGSVKPVDATHTLMDAPEKLRDFTPRIHQLALTKSALDLEEARRLSFKYVEHTGRNPFDVVRTEARFRKKTVESSAIIISDAFGSGKTLVVIMIIVSKQTPPAVPCIMRSPPPKLNVYRYYDNKDETKYMPSCREQQTKLIYPNLIIVGPGVLLKWKDEFKRAAPHFKIFTVGSVLDLKNMYKLYKSGRLNRYNVVLLKNGMVRGTFRLDEEEEGTCDNNDCKYGENCARHIKGTRHLINVVTKMTRKDCWSRVFYDDFDTIQIPMHATHINSLMTYYISATRKHNSSKKRLADVVSVDSILERARLRMLNDTAGDNQLFTNFNLRSEDNFRDESLKLPFVRFYKYVYRNPDDQYIKLIGAMGEQDANEIMEMLNGDAVATAAEAVGIATNTVADIFEKILADKYKKYLAAVKVLGTLDEALAYIATLPPISERFNDKEEHKPYTEREIASITEKLDKGKPHTTIKYQSGDLIDAVRYLRHQKEATKAELGRAIDRVKDNIKEGDCPICCIPLEENDAIINKCCGIVMCAECGIKGARMATEDMYGRRYRDGQETNIRGNCPQCRTVINIQDLIFINQEFDLEGMLKAQGDETTPIIQPKEEAEADDAEAEENPVDKIENPKLKALYQIINNMQPEDKKEIFPHIASLIQGAADVPVPAGTPRKIIVFAAFNETLQNIQTFLKEQEIPYMRLIGSYKQIHQTIADFRTNSTQVMLINSTTNCAGLDLQFTTDLVFFHKIIDTNIQSQVAGRLQRIGRRYNGNIHWLLYRNEKDSIA